MKRLLTRGGALAVTALALYLLAPSLLEVFSSWDQLSLLEYRWLLLVGSAQVVAWAFVWSLQRLVLQTQRWFPVITSQLAGNAASRVVPGGGAAGAALQFQLLRRAGLDTSTAAVGLAAVAVIQFAIVLGLPVLVLPSLLAVPPLEPRFTSIAVSAVVFFALLLLLAAAMLTSNRLLRLLGWTFDRAMARAPLLRPPTTPTFDRLMAHRDTLKRQFGSSWPKAMAFAVGRATFDYLSLIAAIAAFGVDARPALVLLAFATASWLGAIPITPGGLGFVEAGLTGLLVLAGVPAVESVSVAFLYRLFSFWLPIPVGLAAGALHRLRYSGTVAGT